MEVAQRLGQEIPLQRCVDEFQSLSNDYETLVQKHEEYRKTAEVYNAQRVSCKILVDRQLKKIGVLKKTLGKKKSNEETSELLKKIDERENSLIDLKKFLPKKNGPYLSLIVGQMNMVLDSVKEKHKYKDAYEIFKLYLNMATLIISLLLYWVINHRVTDALFSFLLLWYYCTLTVRENILILNGSKIKGWYFIHHYVTIVLAGIYVLWGDQASYQEFRPTFMAFSVYQSLVQLMQCHYQRGCLYRLRALGERDAMDITGEGFHSWMWRGLTFLIPFLVFGHFWQLYNSYVLFRIAKAQSFQVWQVPAMSIIFFILFSCDFFTLVSVVLNKWSPNTSTVRNKNK